MAVTDIQSRLISLGDPAIARHSRRFFKTGPGEYGEGDRFRGIRVPQIRAVAKEFRHAAVADVIGLLESQYHEDRLCALFILVHLFKKGDAALQKNIYDLYLKKTDHINNWDLVDSSAEHIVGAYLFEKSRKPLYTLAKSRSLWERRISIMATFHFIRRNDFDDTLRISDLLLHDKEDLIHKAVGWMLREIGNRNQRVAEEFLQTRYARMPRTMLRYAIEKYSDGRRSQYLNGEV
ncbi:MAG: DNA alkylation repair protein [Spirochaetae bacterium HGW-Spirochaetae-10]|nr:MAG: DNA alkylation repair protein [Spirochaetae bacterium HGW-Spirochaetae-10]